MDEIKKVIAAQREKLDAVHAARMAVRGIYATPVEERGEAAAPLRALLAATPTKRTFKLLAQGDSWFDYPPGTDLIKCLSSNSYGHNIVNIAVAGSTLNDEAYGPVPSELFGLPVGPKQSDEPSRIVELVDRIQQDRPQALLLSAGGNDIAGEEFFSFINNAHSGLVPLNSEVLTGVVDTTFRAGYEYLITQALAAAADLSLRMPIFTHGYDYPWPDGRGVISFLGWNVGPWFDPVFNQKNYPYDKSVTDPAVSGLKVRHDIIVPFIDALNTMLENLAQRYSGQVFHVNLVGTLQEPSAWANELHPGNAGFSALAAKIDAALQRNI